MASEPLTLPALLLRSVDYRDADRIVHLLTPDRGQLAALARSARKSRKRFGGGLESCAVLEVALRPTRGELYGLASARTVRHYPGLLSSLSSLSRAGAALRTLRVMLPTEQAAHEPFADAVALLEHFDAHGSAPHDLAAFQLRLLHHAGLAPDLESCGDCERPTPARRAVLLDPATGRIRCRSCGGAPLYLSADARAWVERVLAGDFSAGPVPQPDSIRELTRVVQGLAAQHLGIELPGDPCAEDRP